MWNETGGQSDPVSAKLKQAIVMYVCRHYDASLNILASMENYKLLRQPTWHISRDEYTCGSHADRSKDHS